MKRIFYVLCLAVTANMIFTSCLKDKDEVTYTVYDEAAISSFILGTLNQYQYELSSSGKIDSLVMYQIAGSVYKMGIDQVNGTITNSDLLPAGTDIKHVLCTVYGLNNGVISLMRPDSTFASHSILDSVDFSNERIFRVYSSDATRMRDYKVSLKVKPVSDDYFAWIKGEVADTTLLSGMAGMKAVTLGDNVFLFGNKDGKTIALSSPDGEEWTQKSGIQFGAASWKNVIVKGQYIYLLDGTKVMRSQDAENWETRCDTTLTLLAGASTTELYAISTTGDMMVSADEGMSWTKDSLDDLSSRLPTDGLASVCFDYPTSDSTDYVLLAGNDGVRTQMWRKIKSYDSTAEPSRWVYMPVSKNNTEFLPYHSQLSIVDFEDMLLAAGNGRNVYMSIDQGITWNEDIFTLPEQMKGEHVTMTLDSRQRLVVVTDRGQVWIGTKY